MPIPGSCATNGEQALAISDVLLLNAAPLDLLFVAFGVDSIYIADQGRRRQKTSWVLSQ
jgi:hypothetical protein